MIAVEPQTIDDDVLSDSSIPEPNTAGGEAVWTGTHSAGDQVISTDLHWKWELAQGGDGSNALPTAIKTNTDDWLSVGPTDRYKMFYLNSTAPSVWASPFEVVLTPGERIDSIGMDGLVADSVRILVEKDSAILYDETIPLLVRSTLTWTDYLAGQFFQVSETGKFDLPLRSGLTVTLTFTRASGDVKVGRLVIGRSTYMGSAELGGDSDSLNLSEWTRNIEGNSEVTPKRSIPTVTASVRSEAVIADKLRRLRVNLDGRIALWAWLEDATHPYFGSGFVIGGYRQFTTTPDLPNYCITKLKVEGA